MVEVDRRGSISAAAEACLISQPSASKQLKTLEAATGEKLVERDGRASRVTEAGALVVAHAVKVLDTLHGLEEQLGALRGAEIGRLTLAASTTAGTHVLPSILQCFADRHPGVKVGVGIGSSSWVAERVAAREHSLGIAGEIELPDGVRTEPFLDDTLVGIAAPGHVTLVDGAASLAELERWTLLIRERGSSTRSVAERFMAACSYSPPTRWELDSDEAIKRSVQAGLGVGFLSELVVGDELQRGDLETFSIEGCEPMRRSMHLLLPDDRNSTPAELAFIDTLGDCCSVSIAGCKVDGSGSASEAR